MTTLAAAVATAADTRSGTTCPRRYGALRCLLRPGTATALAALLIVPFGLSSPATAAAEHAGRGDRRLILYTAH